MASNIPVIVQGNSFSLAIPLQIYIINGDQMELQDYTPDPTDEISIQLKGERRQYTYTPTVDDNICNIDLSGNELAGNYSVVVSIVKASGQRLRSFRTDQFFIVESSDDLTTDDIIQGLEENVIYLNTQCFVAGADGRGIESIVKTGTSGLVDTYTITYTDATTSTFNVTNGAQGAQGADGVGITSIAKTSTSGLVDTYTITMSNGTTTTFDVTNGMDGVDLGLANIVNDLTTGGSTNVLSAEMGKVLNEKSARAVGDKIAFGGASYTTVDISGYTVNHMVRKYVNGALSTKIDNYATCIFVPVTAGEQYEITATARADTPVAFGYTAANYAATVDDILIDATTGEITQVVTIPTGKTYLQLQYANGTCVLRKKTGEDLSTYKGTYIDALTTPKVEWYVPSTIYAIVGVEKSIYLNNLSNSNDYANWFSVDIACSVGRVDTRRWYYTPTTTSDITLTLKAFDYLNNLISTKVVTIKVLSDTLPSSAKNIVCVGDSITQICNMPATIKSLFATFSGTQPAFVGNAGDSTCHHEAYYGRSYNWLVSNSGSPFVYNNAVDIPHWLSGLGISQVDVVSLAMGVNDATSDWATEDGVARMKTLINAFKAQNANTKFIVHLINYPAMGYVDTPANFDAQAKRQYEQEFRQLLIDNYDSGTDANIILGDLGLVYDRFYAHIRSEKHPAPEYTDDTCDMVVDILHPNAQGSRQMGYGIAPSILKMLQD